MPSWMPGKDYLIDFRKGDPYIKVDEGYARLPGAGYEAIHPELEELDPEDYPDIAKLRILGDVAPYSREYQKVASHVRDQARDNPDLEAEYGRIADQVRQTKESTLQVSRRHFNAPVDTVEGTIKSVHGLRVELNEYPGRTFHFSSVGGSMADLMVDTEAWFEDLAAAPQLDNNKPLAWSSIGKIKSIMAQVFKHAQRHELIPAAIDKDGRPTNPVLLARSESGSDYEAAVVTPEQMMVILRNSTSRTPASNGRLPFSMPRPHCGPKKPLG